MFKKEVLCLLFVCPLLTACMAVRQENPEPTASVQTAKEETNSALTISYFRAKVTKPTPSSTMETEWNSDYPLGAGVAVDPGDIVTFEWKSTGAISAALSLAGEQFIIDITGTLTYKARADQSGCSLVYLQVTDRLGRQNEAIIALKFPCPHPLFFDPDQRRFLFCNCLNHGCPFSPPSTSNAFEQHFERGTMIMKKNEGKNSIIVLYDSGKCEILHNDDEIDRLPDPTFEPPRGFYQPAQGFNRVWSYEPYVSDNLGWAIDQGTNFSMTLQSAPSVGRHLNEYWQTLNGHVLQLSSADDPGRYYGCSTVAQE